MAFLDIDRSDGAAISMCRQRVELARATIGAIAVHELTAFDSPLGLRHVALLVRFLFVFSARDLRALWRATSVRQFSANGKL
jgi:hypothetical protein